MIVIGTGGFARDILQDVVDGKEIRDIFFFDDVNSYTSFYNEFVILKNMEEVKKIFDNGNTDYVIGIGNPILRQELNLKFSKLGGNLCHTISQFAKIGKYDVSIGKGCNILSNVIVSNSVRIGKCCILYFGVVITHDCIVGDFVELSPNVTLLGKCEVGSFTQIGANSTILPNIKIGSNVIIGAGSVVTHDLPDGSLAYGVPARILKENYNK